MANVSAKQLRALLEKQQYRCALTGEPLTPNTAVPDHIQPIALGGTNAIDNLQIVSIEANRMKGTLSQQRFLELCALVSACARERSSGETQALNG